MSSTKGYEYVKIGVAFVFTAIATGVTLYKKKDEILAEIKDTQVDELVSLGLVEIKNGVEQVIAAWNMPVAAIEPPTV